MFVLITVTPLLGLQVPQSAPAALETVQCLARLLSPGISQIFYPQRRQSPETELDRLAMNMFGHTTRPWQTRLQRFQAIVPRVHDLGAPLVHQSRQELEQQTLALRHELRAKGFRFDLVAKAFALTREYADRTLGMRHFDVQLLGGWVLFNGMVAEMQTGEGKTLVATLPACAAALAGIPVYIITVNDYLAQRRCRVDEADLPFPGSDRGSGYPRHDAGRTPPGLSL